MKLSSILLASVISVVVQQASALTLTDIADRLATYESYSSTADYEILLASLSEPVRYTLTLESEYVPADTLAPCKYIIHWEIPRQDRASKGFAAYFDGSHYRFRDDRLQEYHISESSEPFQPLGRKDRGVQRQAQFVELLPQFIGERFKKMVTDTTYTVTVTPDSMTQGVRSIVVSGRQEIYGVVASEFEYILDPETFMPRSIDLENNPGQMGEQNIVVTYGNPSLTKLNINYDSLASSESEAFSKYRESTFTLESLPGRQLPRIMAPTMTGERYLHERGERFNAPTIFVFTDTEVGSTPELIKNIRGAVTMLPFQVDIVWAFKNHRQEEVRECMDTVDAGETVLFNAGGAARECGIGALLPVLVFTDQASTVADVQVGYNNDMASIVIQKVMTAKEGLPK